MKALLIRVLALIILVVNCPMTNGFRVIKLKDLDPELSYIPVTIGEKFIVEIEASPESTGFIWTLESLDLGPASHNRQAVETLNLVHPLNLDEHHEGEFFKRPKSNNNNDKDAHEGVYHFEFKVNTEGHTGSETLSFIHRKPSTMEGHTEKQVYLSISARKDEL